MAGLWTSDADPMVVACGVKVIGSIQLGSVWEGSIVSGICILRIGIGCIDDNDEDKN